MKVPFRVALLAVLIALLVPATAVLVMNAYRNSFYAITDLSSQLFEQTSERIGKEIEVQLAMAPRQSSATLKSLRGRPLTVAAFPRLIEQWSVFMDLNLPPADVFVCLATGDSTGITRVPGALVVLQTHRDPEDSRLEVLRYPLADYPAGGKPDTDSITDLRGRPWYKDAKRLRRASWTEAYVFSRGDSHIYGVSYSTPVLNQAGQLSGVFVSSFELADLCRSLLKMHVAKHGYAFIIERRPDGNRHIIVHPRVEFILGEDNKLVSVDKFGDPVARAFVGRVRDNSEDSPAPISFTVDGVRYFGSYHHLEKSPLYPANWTICIVVPQSDILARIDQNYRFSLWLALGFFVLILVFSYLISAQVARPLERLGQETRAIGSGHLEPKTLAHSIVAEVDDLGVAMEDMKTGLRSFQKYVPAELVRELMGAGQEAALGGERRVLTLFFSDLKDSTTIAERQAPEAFVEQLREYLGALSGEILATGGTVDKYIGDAVMAFWNAPKPLAGHARAACTAALRCQECMRRLREEWHQRGLPPFHTRIGINTGEVVVGNIGSDTRLNYTAIGDPVNLAARLEGVNKRYGTEIVVSEHTYRLTGDAIVVRPLDWIVVKGKSEVVQIYELIGLKGQVDAATLEWIAAYGDGLEHYRQRNWPGAIACCDRALRLRPDDAASQVMLVQCRRYTTHPPDDDWDGVFRTTEH